jgi:hypothetical protein
VIAWLVIAWGRKLLRNEKPRPHPKMQTGSFVLSPLARLLHLTGKLRDAGFVPAAPGILVVKILFVEFCWRFLLVQSRRGFRAPYAAGDSAKDLPVPPQRQNEGRLVPFTALASVVS